MNCAVGRPPSFCRFSVRVKGKVVIAVFALRCGGGGADSFWNEFARQLCQFLLLFCQPLNPNPHKLADSCGIKKFWYGTEIFYLGETAENSQSIGYIRLWSTNRYSLCAMNTFTSMPIIFPHFSVLFDSLCNPALFTFPAEWMLFSSQTNFVHCKDFFWQVPKHSSNGGLRAKFYTRNQHVPF